MAFGLLGLIKEQIDGKKKIQKLMVSSWFTSVKIVIEKLIQAKSDSGNSWQSYGEVHKVAGWYEIQFVFLSGLAATVAILSFDSYRRNTLAKRMICVAHL